MRPSVQSTVFVAGAHAAGAVAANLDPHCHWVECEPNLEALLAAPETRMVMRADGVRKRDLVALLGRVESRRKAKAP